MCMYKYIFSITRSVYDTLFFNIIIIGIFFFFFIVAVIDFVCINIGMRVARSPTS